MIEQLQIAAAAKTKRAEPSRQQPHHPGLFSTQKNNSPERRSIDPSLAQLLESVVLPRGPLTPQAPHQQIDQRDIEAVERLLQKI
jgi:hypothetical protein